VLATLSVEESWKPFLLKLWQQFARFLALNMVALQSYLWGRRNGLGCDTADGALSLSGTSKIELGSQVLCQHCER
jgi:hypothetical protein